MLSLFLAFLILGSLAKPFVMMIISATLTTLLTILYGVPFFHVSLLQEEFTTTLLSEVFMVGP